MSALFLWKGGWLHKWETRSIIYISSMFYDGTFFRVGGSSATYISVFRFRRARTLW
jgi:hypothetical protein